MLHNTYIFLHTYRNLLSMQIRIFQIDKPILVFLLVHWLHLKSDLINNVCIVDRGSGNEKVASSDGKKSADQCSKLEAGVIKFIGGNCILK